MNNDWFKASFSNTKNSPPLFMILKGIHTSAKISLKEELFRKLNYFSVRGVMNFCVNPNKQNMVSILNAKSHKNPKCESSDLCCSYAFNSTIRYTLLMCLYTIAMSTPKLGCLTKWDAKKIVNSDVYFSMDLHNLKLNVDEKKNAEVTSRQDWKRAIALVFGLLFVVGTSEKKYFMLFALENIDVAHMSLFPFILKCIC